MCVCVCVSMCVCCLFSVCECFFVLFCSFQSSCVNRAKCACCDFSKSRSTCTALYHAPEVARGPLETLCCEETQHHSQPASDLLWDTQSHPYLSSASVWYRKSGVARNFLVLFVAVFHFIGCCELFTLLMQCFSSTFLKCSLACRVQCLL